ncbi:MAG: type II toxin-antitoxin system RelE/ParE family toxin [Oscillospiraceae bacterium]|nr:type II toxin-antitoxin system RelE/ParE family toxin [Oscillospiraceae bacterium]
MKIKYEKKALKYLAKTEKSIVENIKNAINGLTETPPKGDVKLLSGYKDGRKRLRFGKYRIIFKFDQKEITVLLILNIGTRGGIYKED